MRGRRKRTCTGTLSAFPSKRQASRPCSPYSGTASRPELPCERAHRTCTGRCSVEQSRPQQRRAGRSLSARHPLLGRAVPQALQHGPGSQQSAHPGRHSHSPVRLACQGRPWPPAMAACCFPVDRGAALVALDECQVSRISTLEQKEKEEASAYWHLHLASASKSPAAAPAWPLLKCRATCSCVFGTFPRAETPIKFC